MLSGWSRASLLPLARWRPPSGSLIAGLLALVLILCIANSTVLANWVPGSAPVTNLALVGLIPGAAAFATNVLNFPNEQNGYTLVFLVLTMGLLLWTNYLRSLESAVKRRVKLSSDARWDFWESGVVVGAVVFVLGIFLPPLSSTDSTVNMENGTFRGWAELQQRLDHPV